MNINKLKNLIVFIIRSGLSLTSIQFVFVGISCLIFAEAVLYLFVDILHLNSIIAVIVATELSVLLNFYVNDNWTFRKLKNLGGCFMSRLLKFHVSRIVNIGLFALLNEIFLIHYLLSYFLAALVAFAINFITSILWVWRTYVPTHV